MFDRLYTVNENGQMEINFESLELETDKKFVNHVKSKLEGKSIQNFFIDNFDTVLKMVVVSDYFCYTFMYDKVENYYFTNVIDLLDMQRLNLLKEGVL